MKISIVVTAYNVEAYIEQALRSCMEQTYGEIEIVTVDDCSTDSTSSILDRLASEDGRIRVIKHEMNLGAGQSRRTGISSSCGEYVLLLDGDDYLERDFVEALAERAIETDADVVSGGMTVLRGGGAWDRTCYGDEVITGVEKVTRHWGNRVVFLANKIVRRSLYDVVPYCGRRFIEDTPVLIPLMYLANKVAYVSNTGYNYRMRSDSLTHKADAFKYALFRVLCVQDLIDFFEANDKEYLNIIPLEKSYRQLIGQIKRLSPSRDMIMPYTEEWMEFTRELIRRI